MMAANGAMKLAGETRGEGRTVVLLHGFPEYRVTWRRQMDALASAGFRAIAPDLRGYGSSPKPQGIDAYRIPLLVEDVAGLIEETGGSAIVAGHDWGAFVAWFLAMMRPELVSKLVVMNVPHPASFARELARSREQRWRALYQQLFQLPLLPELFMKVAGRSLMRRSGRFTEAEVDDCVRSWRGSLTPMFNYYRAMRRTRGELRSLIRPIGVPVLLIWGAREPVFIRASAETSVELVPDFRFELIPRAGHFVHHDTPERVNELLVGFARRGNAGWLPKESPRGAGRA